MMNGHSNDQFELMENMGEVFTCEVCKEICNEDRLHVHRLCANPPDFVDHPFYENQRFHFRRESRPFQQCNACGGDIKGANYKILDKKLDLHPCCAHLPLRLLDNRGGRGGGAESSGKQMQMELVLHHKLSSECFICGKVRIEGLKTWYYKCKSTKARWHVACVKKVLDQIYSNNMEAGGLSVLAAPDKMPAVKKKKKKEEEEEDSFWETIGKTALTMILTALIGLIMPFGAAAIADGITSLITIIIQLIKRNSHRFVRVPRCMAKYYRFCCC